MIDTLRQDIAPKRINGCYNGEWTIVLECPICRVFTRLKDVCVSFPCWRCGCVKKPIGHVGKWISKSKWYLPETWGTGIWLTKDAK